MQQKIIIISSIVVINILLFVAYDYLRHDKIGIVRTGELLDRSKRMKELNLQLEKEFSITAGNVDTLQKRCERLSLIKSTEAKLACDEFERYRETAVKQIEQRKQELIGKELEAINKQIEAYGKAHRYKLILGTTKDGNVLFAQKADDITDALIEYVNQ